MATAPIPSVPDRARKGHPGRKPMSKATKAKLAAALKRWRDNLTAEDRAELAARSRAKWDNLNDKERRARLAGVRAWRKTQRAAARAKAKRPANAGAKPKGTTPSPHASSDRGASRRSRKAVTS